VRVRLRRAQWIDVVTECCVERLGILARRLTLHAAMQQGLLPRLYAECTVCGRQAAVSAEYSSHSMLLLLLLLPVMTAGCGTFRTPLLSSELRRFDSYTSCGRVRAAGRSCM